MQHAVASDGRKTGRNAVLGTSPVPMARRAAVAETTSVIEIGRRKERN